MRWWAGDVELDVGTQGSRAWEWTLLSSKRDNPALS